MMDLLKSGQPFALSLPAHRTPLLLAGLIPLLGLVLLAAVGLGAVQIGPGQVVTILARQIGLNLPITYESQQAMVLLAIRLPRVILGLLIGATLAVSGAAVQGLFRNPLADPTLIGRGGKRSCFYHVWRPRPLYLRPPPLGTDHV
jgi:iron complex transport system permease protein